MTPSISVKNVIKKRGKITLNVDQLQLDKGFIYTVYGKNGHGKTSFIKLLAGAISNGKASIQNLGSVSYVPSDDQTLHGMSQKTICTLFNKGNKNFDLKLFTDFLRQFKLSGFEMMNELSKGERKCVLIALALACHSQTLLLDEPFNGVDAPNKDIIIKLLQTFVNGEDKTVIMAINQLDDVLDITDYYLNVHQGNVSNPISVLELQESYQILEVNGEELLQSGYISKVKTNTGYKVLIPGANDQSNNLVEVLLMLGGRDRC